MSTIPRDSKPVSRTAGERLAARAPAAVSPEQSAAPNARAKALKWFAWLCLAAAFALASYVIFHEYRFSLNTDGAVEDVLAKLAVEEGRLVPHNWTYANGDLWILGPRLFLIIAFPWLGLGYPLHAAATWLTYVYLLLMVYGTCRALAPERPRAAVVATTLAAGGFSMFSFEFVIGEGAYSLYAALALALFVFASRRNASGRRWRHHAPVLMLSALAAAMVCVSNATRGAVTVIAPLIAGWFAATVLFSPLPRRERVRHLNWPIIISIVIGALGGTLAFKYWLLPGIINSSGAASFELNSVAQMKQNLMALPSSWLTYFQVAGGWQWLPLPQRILQCIIWLLSIGLLLAPLRVVIACRRYSCVLVDFSWITLACFTVTLVALVASQKLFAGFWSVRYATFAIYASVCVLAIVVDDLFRHRSRLATSLTVLLCLMPVATIAAWRTEWTPGGVTYAQRMGLIESLEAHRVGSVLATYWNSGVLSVLSAGKLEGLPVDLTESSGLRRHAQNSPRTADPSIPGSRFAIALTTQEAPPGIWKRIYAQLGKPANRYRSGPFVVVVYDRDIVRLFYGNDASSNTPVSPEQLMVQLSQLTFPPCQATRPCEVSVEATNTGTHALASSGTTPLRLGIQEIDAQGRVVRRDAGRADFATPIEPGASERVTVSLPPMSDPKATAYRLCLLQENVAWHCNRTQPAKSSGTPN